MATRVVTLRRNADGTFAVRIGRAIEHISIEAKTHGQIFDAVKCAICSKGVDLPEIEVAELLYQATGEYYKMVGGHNG